MKIETAASGRECGVPRRGFLVQEPAGRLQKKGRRHAGPFPRKQPPHPFFSSRSLVTALILPVSGGKSNGQPIFY